MTGAWVRLSLTAALVAGSASALAQQPAQPMSGPGAVLDLGLPPPTDTGKARFYAPPLDPAPPGCAAVFDCRLRVFGAVRHNGAVGLNAALLRW